MWKEIDTHGRHFELYTSRGNGLRPITARRQGPRALQRKALPAWPLFSQGEIHAAVHSKSDILAACQKGCALVAQLGFPPDDGPLITNVLSELAGNILRCCQQGATHLRVLEKQNRWVVVVSAFA